MHDAVFVSFALVIALAGAVLLWRIRHADYCSQCVHCRHEAWLKSEERRVAAEKADAVRHLNFHRMYGVDMGDDHCPTCAKEKS